MCHKLIEPKDIIIDAKSGITGAGRMPKMHILYGECNESFSAYSVGNHRHEPEIDQVLSHASGQTVETIFTPHMVPMDRGILCTMYARPLRSLSQADAIETMRGFYHGKPFVRVVDHLPSTKDVAHTNYCHMTARVTHGRLIVISTLDNLIKGASGVAVQNFNLMNGFLETMGLPR